MERLPILFDMIDFKVLTNERVFKLRFLLVILTVHFKRKVLRLMLLDEAILFS